MNILNLGIVGACGRGGSFKAACDAIAELRVHAVCDINRAGLEETRLRLGASEAYVDFEEMLEKSDLDAVLVGTPMPLHVPQAILALQQNLHVLSEVPASVSIEECQRLVQVYKASQGLYMMAENYPYRKNNAIVREIVRQGLFGVPYYAEGEYLHELKERDERRLLAQGVDLNTAFLWRRKWQNGIDGVTYGTHSLGPVLQWMPGDRVVSVCCAGSGHHYRDPGGNNYAQDTSVMLGRMASGGLVKIRVDMISDRPHAMTNYQLQGTDGCYESARAPGERDRIWLRSHSPDANTWLDLADLEREFLPASWRKGAKIAGRTGHGGGDYFVIRDFVDAVLGKQSPAIGLHEALDMTLPGLVSQQSIAQGGAWLPVPDSRMW